MMPHTAWGPSLHIHWCKQVLGLVVVILSNARARRLFELDGITLEPETWVPYPMVLHRKHVLFTFSNVLIYAAE